eukprot:TRINITY_DN974_c0_g1_i2.p1 TRINITY_DN974_c0_g1~~TRINITY_DN974_c0_g1_i2.p1  ORF type:complete len:814 (+),score=83.00 TRINITY_DN974_c0_g1_i2:8390-10831(+)
MTSAFDTDKLFELRYDPLKQVIEYLLRRDKEVTAVLQSLVTDDDFVALSQSTDKKAFIVNKQSIEASVQDLRLKKLEDKIAEQDEKLTKFENVLDPTTSSTLQIFRHEIKTEGSANPIEPSSVLEQRIAKLEEIINSLSSKEKMVPGALHPATNVTAGISREDNAQITQEDFTILEKQTAYNTGEINRFKELFKRIEESVAIKANSEDVLKLKAEIEEAKAVPTPRSEYAPVLQSKESQLLSEVADKIPLLELQIRETAALYQNIDLEEINGKLDELYKVLEEKADLAQLQQEQEKICNIESNAELLITSIKANHEDIMRIKAKLELLESKTAYMTKTINEIYSKSDYTSPNARGKPGTIVREKTTLENLMGAAIPEAEWTEVRNNLAQLNKSVTEIFGELEILRDLRKKYIAFQTTLDQKMDKSEFEAWKNENNFVAILAESSKKFAAKADTRASLKKLKARITVLENTLLSKDDSLEISNDKAMLIKKHLGGWSCASCQKDLVNIAAGKASYYPWAKLPNVQKVPKVGYSRVLSLVKPEMVSRSQPNLVVGAGKAQKIDTSQRDAYESANENQEQRPNSAHDALPEIGGIKRQKVQSFITYLDLIIQINKQHSQVIIMKGSPMANHTRKPLLSVQKGFPVVVVPRQPKSTTSLPLSGPTLKHFKAKPQRNIPLIPLQTPRIVMSQKPSATSTARSKSFKGKVASLVKQKYFNHSRIPLRLASSSPSLLDILMKSQQKSYENSYCHQKASLEQLKQTICYLLGAVPLNQRKMPHKLIQPRILHIVINVITQLGKRFLSNNVIEVFTGDCVSI